MQPSEPNLRPRPCRNCSHRAPADQFHPYARIFPIELVRTCFVAHPIALGIPERSCFQANHGEARARQALQKYTAAAPTPTMT